MRHEATLRTSDVGALIRLAGEVGEIPVGLVGRGAHALAALARLVDADVCMAAENVTDAAGRALRTDNDRACMVGVDPALFAAHSAFASGPDPFPLAPWLVPPPAPIAVLMRQQVMDDRDWYRHPYVNEVCRPARSDQTILARLRQGGLDVSACVARDFGRRPFDPRHLRLVELFQAEIVPRVFARPPASPPLPPRLRPVLDRLLAGDSEKQVALRLGLSPHTVHQYVKLIHKALGVSSRGELLARCLGAEVARGA